ncbi:MAG: hypothetical protein HQM15_04870 [Deltaproteobacteria bacterium]|nr:hypothetical protein [Deltaproteobacteria bacterium]
MISSNSLATGEVLGKSYGFQVRPAVSARDSIQDLVAQGKIVGEWNENFKIYALPEMLKQRPPKWIKEEPFKGVLQVDAIKNIWQAMDYFGEGELDVLITPENSFLFPQEGRSLLEGIRGILENRKDPTTGAPTLGTDFNFESDDPFLNNLQGKLLTLKGNISEAGKAFGKALALLPEYSEPYANLGTLLWQLGQQKEAFVLFVEALLRNPYNVAAQLNFFDAGRETENFDGMIKVVEKILEMDPECLEFYPILAFSYHRSGQAGKAIDILNNFLAKYPQEEEARLLLEHIKSHLQ